MPSWLTKSSKIPQLAFIAHNPYHLALKFNMKNVFCFLNDNNETELPIVAEARGRKEDNELELEFLRLMSSGHFSKLNCSLVFQNKRDNIAGIQLADLCAHPCARHILKPSQPNQAYEIAMAHVYRKGELVGWKIFPETK